MTTIWLAGDDAIEAIFRGDEVDADLAPLAAFARGVRALGDEQVPVASAALSALFAPDSTRPLHLHAAELGSKRRMNGSGAATALGKVAGLSLLRRSGSERP